MTAAKASTPSTKKSSGKDAAGSRKKAVSAKARGSEPVSKAGSRSRKAPAQRVAAPEEAPARPPVPSVRRDAEEYRGALSAYAACMELLRKKDWRIAAKALTEFIDVHHRERELVERAHMYLRVCEQHLGAEEVVPEDPERLYNLAVVLANQGEYDRALVHLEKLLSENPDSDKALYLRASTLALKGNRKGALEALSRAIVLDDRNRIYAAGDPDFSPLHDDEEFITLTTREDEQEG